MFRAHCAAEGTEVLLTTRRITGIRRDGGEVVVEFRCWCGRAGRTVDRTRPQASALLSGPRSA